MRASGKYPNLYSGHISSYTPITLPTNKTLICVVRIQPDLLEWQRSETKRPVRMGKVIAMLKILLVDDHVLCRESVAAHLLGCPRISAVFEANDVRKALRLLSERSIDIALVSIDILTDGVLDAARAMRRISRSIRIIFLGERPCDTDIEEALEMPADGIILRRDSLASLAEAINCVVRGEDVLQRVDQEPTRECGKPVEARSPEQPGHQHS